MSTEEEVKWMTRKWSWKYIPDRYQALVATIASGFLYFNIFNVVFSDHSSGDCGSYFRPKIDGGDEPYRLGWFWNVINYDNDLKCSEAYFGGLYWEFLFTFAGLAICGLVMRRAIKRDDAAKSS